LTAKSQIQIRKSFPALTGAFSEFDEVALYHYRIYVEKMVDFTKDMDVLGKGFDRFKDFDLLNPQVFSAPFTTAGPTINGIQIAPSIEAGRRTPPKYSRTLNDAM